MDTKKLIDQKLEYWKKKLIDLSKRNNLVRYRFTKSKSIKIISPDLKKILEDLNHENNIVILKEKSDKSKDRQWTTSEDEKTIEKKIYTLYTKTKENFQELGINTCFVSLGILKYKEADSSELFLEAPILLFQVEIERLKGVSKEYHQFEINSNSGELQINPALREKLLQEFRIELKDPKDEQSITEYLDDLKDVISAKKGWSISSDIYMDIFSYQKYIMYKDLTEHKELVQDADLVKAFVGDSNALQDEISESRTEDFDDATSVDVLEADSSQKRAIEFAKAGTTFVLQGPPGTGKSQTIVNIISALIERNKKILFVSQKIAALNVVQKRLNEVGLGRYCLNLHVYRGNKKAIVNQLMTEMVTSPKIPSNISRSNFDDYLQTQKEINEYYQYLCEQHSPWELSIYEIRGELAKLHSVPIIDKSLITISKLNSKDFLMFKGRTERLDSFFDIVADPFNHVYFNFKKEKNTSLIRNRLGGDLSKLLEQLGLLQKELGSIQKKTGIPIDNFTRLEEFNKLENILSKVDSKEVPTWIVSKDFNEKTKIINNLNKIHTEIHQLEGIFSESIKKEFIQQDTREAERIFKNTNLIARWFSSEYKKAKKELSGFSKKPLSHGEWIKLFEEKSQYHKSTGRLNKEIEDNKKVCDLIGDCNIRQLIHKLDQITLELLDVFKEANKLDNEGFKLIEYILKSNTQIEKLTENIKHLSKNINDLFEKDVLNPDKGFREMVESVKIMRSEFDKINDVQIFREELERFQPEIKEFIIEYIKLGTKIKFSNLLLKSYYLQILDELTKSNKAAPKQLIEKFKNEDVTIRDIWRYKIMESVEKTQPKESFSGSNSGEQNILKRESEKKRKLKPVRDLLQAIPNLVFKLKPCFMMSPLTVSQYIDPKLIKFDVVIFDEASQIMPEDAVPCLIRAKQAIIMGDTQQLPPTSFFLSQDDDEIEEELEDLESFLSEASTKFRSKSLDWHYRSHNENLIAFSNRFFYENRLITFPNSKINDESGLDFFYVKNGIYDRGKSRKNTEEAKVVVETYKKLKKYHPNKSIGIIAFSIQQEKAIKEQFQASGITIEETIDPQNEDTFIKNLETVQGDERDIIIISIGYGKDSTGKFSYNFGPLNRESGYKRLNVAITRSRFKTLVVSSLLPSELESDKLKSEGTRKLKDYLDYAKNKDFTKFVTVSEGIEFDSTFEESVYDELSKLGFEISTQVGCSGYKVDIAIKNPKKLGEYILGIECDGAQYHSSRYARDRDKVRQSILEGLGWNIHRIWSEDWLKNRDFEIEKIKNRVQGFSKQKAVSEMNKKHKFAKVEDIKDFKEVSLKSKYENYAVCELPIKNVTLEFDSYGNLNNYYHKRDIKERIKKILEVEGPIEKELLFKRVLDSFGIQKLGSRINSLFEDMLKDLKQEDGCHIHQDTIALKKIMLAPVRISTEEQRQFIFIPKEELASAIVDILKSNYSTTKEALTADISREIYNNLRTGSKIQSKMDDAIKYLLANRLIEGKNGKIQLTKNG